LLFYGDRVALAVRSFEHDRGDLFEELLKTYQSEFRGLSALPASGTAARYYFAEDGSDRLMLCGARTSSGDLTITLAVGHRAVMDALRMSPKAAQEDAKQAEKLRTPETA
jgi:hypothetical protein